MNRLRQFFTRIAQFLQSEPDPTLTPSQIADLPVSCCERCGLPFEWHFEEIPTATATLNLEPFRVYRGCIHARSRGEARHHAA